ncbi:MAG: LysR family transcriptional regulator [Eubacteriales bacterium]|nr:LysR family transcriptional regulator [Clostridiales bacterium]MDO5544361.1 LysR family transcriptional regulator [Eubacteriales bacterium]
MNSQMIKCFNALCQTRNFTKAADSLYMSQSSFSKCLKSLEAELGCNLIDRRKTPISLTEAGEVFAKYSVRFVELHNDMMTELQPYLANTEQHLRISAIPLVLDYGAVRTITSFQAITPKLRIDYLECDQAKTLQSLANNTSDVGIVRIDTLDLSLYDYVVISEEELVVVCNSSSPLSKKGSVSIRDLRNEPFITFDRSSELYAYVISACERCGFFPKIANISSRVNIMLGMVSENVGIALLPAQLAKKFQSNFPVSILKLSDPIITKTAFVKLKASVADQTVVSDFWKYIHDTFD